MPIQFTFRCPIDWNSMKGDDTRRFCGMCDKHVTNISNMTPDAARTFLDGTLGTNTCITATADAEGRVRFKDGAIAAGAAAIMIASGPAFADGSLPTLPELAHEEVEDIDAGGELLDVDDENCDTPIPDTANVPMPDVPMPGGMMWIPPTPPAPVVPVVHHDETDAGGGE